jgi:hypothetical protein
MVTKLHFSAVIRAPRRRVWQTMLHPTTYGEWTAAFAPGSRYEGSWAEGERIRFLAGTSGMVAEIAANREFEFLSIRHLGFVQDGVDDTTSDAVRAWAPAYENYTFHDCASGTELRIEQDVTAEFESYMRESWPKALDALKALCER